MQYALERGCSEGREGMLLTLAVLPVTSEGLATVDGTQCHMFYVSPLNCQGLSTVTSSSNN